MDNFDLKKYLAEGRLHELIEQQKEVSDSDLFTAEYNGKKIEIERKFLKQGEERNLLQKLKKFNLGSGHEEMELLKINDDFFVFRLVTYYGAPVQIVYFERVK